MKLFLVLIVLLVFPLKEVFAHVRYIADDEQVSRLIGLDFGYLFESLYNPQFLILSTICIVVTLVLYFAVVSSPDSLMYLRKMGDRVSTYGPMVAWALRICVGIALIGFGTNSTLMSPIVQIESVNFMGHFLPFIQILTGFFLLLGFLTSITSLLVVALYFIALTTDWYILGSLDVLGIALSLIILDARVPGIDHILNIPDEYHPNLVKYVPTILRFCLGFAFLFLAVYEKFINPHLSEYVVYATKLQEVIPVSASMWVLGAGLVEVVIALAIIFGFKMRLFSAITFIVLSLSFFYFKEDVVSHVTLFGVLAVLFVTGAGPLSLDSLFGKWHKNKEKIKRASR